MCFGKTKGGVSESDPTMVRGVYVCVLCVCVCGVGGHCVMSPHLNSEE